MSIYQLSDTVSISSQIRTDDVANLADMGFTTIICNRPDGEDFGQPTADEIAEACAARDMNFYFIPVDRSGLTKEMVNNFHGAVTQSAGKVVSAAAHPDGGYAALAVLQIGSAEGAADLHLGTPEGPRVTLEHLPYPFPTE